MRMLHLRANRGAGASPPGEAVTPDFNDQIVDGNFYNETWVSMNLDIMHGDQRIARDSGKLKHIKMHQGSIVYRGGHLKAWLNAEFDEAAKTAGRPQPRPVNNRAGHRSTAATPVSRRTPATQSTRVSNSREGSSVKQGRVELEVRRRTEELMKLGYKKVEARKEIFSRDPALHQALLEEANAGKPKAIAAIRKRFGGEQS